jgi:5-methylcytosine-specific restriction enzyme subunit McrC
MNSDQRTIVAYEHQRLTVAKELCIEEYRALAAFHDRSSEQYFDLCADGIKLRQFVGILVVGNFAIEILPKTDQQNSQAGDTRWRRALLEMLCLSGIIHPELHATAAQAVDEHGLFYALVSQFFMQLEVLLREGLVKKYRSDQGNIPVYKGRVLFARHVALNLTKVDRWYSDHSIYDCNHAVNGIIRLALDILGASCPAILRQQLQYLRMEFQDIHPFEPDQNYMDKLHYDRRTSRYRSVMDLAWLMIRNLSPNLITGKNPVFALLFDMNQLFETTVYNVLAREISHSSDTVRIKKKQTSGFWKNCYLVPDIILEDDTQKIIVDTKWKIVADGKVGEADLRQVFAYGLYFGATKVVLLYPKALGASVINEPFAPIPHHPDISLSCSLVFADLVLEDGTINKEFASVFIHSLFDMKVDDSCV